MKILEGKGVMITGESCGPCTAITYEAAMQVGKVAFTYPLNIEQGQALETAELDATAKVHLSYSSDLAQADKLVNEVIAGFGSQDVLVNNFGITQNGPLIRMSEKQW